LLAALACTSACERPGGQRDAATLVAAISSDPGHLNPAITTNGGVHTASGLLYDGLLALDDSFRPLPALAERWEVDDGGARYRFHLRRNVRWHDGQPFTSADVQFTFDSLLLRFHARTRASLGAALQRVSTPDSFTVDFQFKRPYAPLLQQLNEVEAPILPRHLYAGSDPQRNPANTKPVGTGPFRFVEYRTNSEIRYAANADYFAGKPALDAVVLREIPDAGTQVIALEAGEVDWLFEVPGPQRAQLRGDKRVRLIQTTVGAGGSNCVLTLGFNLDRPWFRDVRVRRAVAQAVDRQQVLDRIQFGEGRVSGQPISSQIPFARATGLTIPAHDTAAAGKLLDSVGWKLGTDGVRTAHGVPGVADGTRFVVNFRGLPAQAVYGDLLRAQLRAVGIDLRVESLEQAVFVQTIFTARDFDTAIASYCNGPDPEIGVRRQYVSSSVAPVPFSNMAGYRNPVMDSLFDRAGAAIDPNERQRFYNEIQQIAVRDQPYVWLVETTNSRAHSTRCNGFATGSHFAATAKCGPTVAP
jgi:peptide/nickel transport system substrate-binding protein